MDKQCDRLIRWIEEELGSTNRGFKQWKMASASRWLVSNILGDLVASELCASPEEGQGQGNMLGAKRGIFSRLIATLLPGRVMRDFGSHDEHDWAPGYLK